MTTHIVDVIKSPVTQLPDGSAFATGSFPLPEDHWLFDKKDDEEPKPLTALVLDKSDEELDKLRRAVRDAAEWAIRGATNKGTDLDFDPDALSQAFVYALIGPFDSAKEIKK